MACDLFLSMTIIYLMTNRLARVAVGIAVGGLMGGLYAFLSQAINGLFLPGVPLKPSGAGSFLEFIWRYFLSGALLGGVASFPESKWLGTFLGGFAGALGVTLLGISSLRGGEERALGLFVMAFYLFLPLVVMYMSFAYLVRLGVNSQFPDPQHPELWARRFLVPLLLLILVIFVSAFSLYGRAERKAFQTVHQMVEEARKATNVQSLPVSFQSIQGYLENARGAYFLSLSDRVDLFMGPQPVNSPLSQFLIVGEFENGFSFACLFQGEQTIVPYCTNFSFIP
ncbi:hypothetical protein ANT_14250 [Anaerolinea thermophila UNI-1]|uniref:Uncharacterized protein n=2 Tax=Anaerolineaceae TaxID=292628 RepID=E8N4T9_ANATU|nr:hypothetical protein ANT_14250 [Anaerolinea thermophila UNI-1]